MQCEIELVKKFLEIGVVKFGNFMLKSGNMSPVYIDLRQIISFPLLLKELSEKVWEKKTVRQIVADVVCGVPYTALPIATALSVLHGVPMVLKRQEAKDYGTKKIVEGVFKAGQKCLVIEDTVTTGASILETAEVLKREGLVVTDCIVIMNRQQGADAILAKSGITLHSLFQIQDLISVISEHKLVSASLIGDAQKYLENTKFVDVTSKQEFGNQSFSERSKATSNSVLKKLFTIMELKKSNLCVAVDVETSSELLKIADLVGPHVCIVKTHIDILKDFNEQVTLALKDLAGKHNFLIMEDRKFADIGNTVTQQYRSGVYKIQNWADITTVHSLPGNSIVRALKISSVSNRACVLVAQMSSEGALTTPTYAGKSLEIAKNHKDFVIGFISQSRLSKDGTFIHMSPGVHIGSDGDSCGQLYRTPEEAIEQNGADIVVVGRGITKSDDIVKSALSYKVRAYKSYMDTVKK